MTSINAIKSIFTDKKSYNPMNATLAMKVK